MAEKFANTGAVAITTLEKAVVAGATTIEVKAAAPPPNLQGAGTFRIEIEGATAGVFEVMRVTAVAGKVWTVERAQEGTANESHAAGKSVFHRLTAGGLLQAILDQAAGASTIVLFDGGTAVTNYANPIAPRFDLGGAAPGTFGEYKLRRDSEGNWLATNPVIGDGEVILNTSAGHIKVGDGVKKYSALTDWAPVTGITGVEIGQKYLGISGGVAITVQGAPGPKKGIVCPAGSSVPEWAEIAASGGGNVTNSAGAFTISGAAAAGMFPEASGAAAGSWVTPKFLKMEAALAGITITGTPANGNFLEATAANALRWNTPTFLTKATAEKEFLGISGGAALVVLGKPEAGAETIQYNTVTGKLEWKKPASGAGITGEATAAAQIPISTGEKAASWKPLLAKGGAVSVAGTLPSTFSYYAVTKGVKVKLPFFNVVEGSTVIGQQGALIAVEHAAGSETPEVEALRWYATGVAETIKLNKGETALFSCDESLGWQKLANYRSTESVPFVYAPKTAGTSVLQIRHEVDTNPRIDINNDGLIQLGPGTAAVDTELKRSGRAGMIKTGAYEFTGLPAGTNLVAGAIVGEIAGAVPTGAFLEGDLVFDRTTKTIWAFKGGVWTNTAENWENRKIAFPHWDNNARSGGLDAQSFDMTSATGKVKPESGVYHLVKIMVPVEMTTNEVQTIVLSNTGTTWTTPGNRMALIAGSNLANGAAGTMLRKTKELGGVTVGSEWGGSTVNFGLRSTKWMEPASEVAKSIILQPNNPTEPGFVWVVLLANFTGTAPEFLGSGFPGHFVDLNAKTLGPNTRIGHADAAGGHTTVETVTVANFVVNKDTDPLFWVGLS